MTGFSELLGLVGLLGPNRVLRAAGGGGMRTCSCLELCATFAVCPLRQAQAFWQATLMVRPVQDNITIASNIAYVRNFVLAWWGRGRRGVYQAGSRLEGFARVMWCGVLWWVCVWA